MSRHVPNPAFRRYGSFWTPYLTADAQGKAEKAAKVAPEPAPQPVVVVPDYPSMTLAELRDALAARGVDVPKTWNRIKLIKELSAV